MLPQYISLAETVTGEPSHPQNIQSLERGNTAAGKPGAAPLPRPHFLAFHRARRAARPCDTTDGTVTALQRRTIDPCVELPLPLTGSAATSRITGCPLNCRLGHERAEVEMKERFAGNHGTYAAREVARQAGTLRGTHQCQLGPVRRRLLSMTFCGTAKVEREDRGATYLCVATDPHLHLVGRPWPKACLAAATPSAPPPRGCALATGVLTLNQVALLERQFNRREIVEATGGAPLLRDACAARLQTREVEGRCHRRRRTREQRRAVFGDVPHLSVGVYHKSRCQTEAQMQIHLYTVH